MKSENDIEKESQSNAVQGHAQGSTETYRGCQGLTVVHKGCIQRLTGDHRVYRGCVQGKTGEGRGFSYEQFFFSQ